MYTLLPLVMSLSVCPQSPAECLFLSINVLIDRQEVILYENLNTVLTNCSAGASDEWLASSSLFFTCVGRR